MSIDRIEIKPALPGPVEAGGRAGRPAATALARRAAFVAPALVLFILSLELLKRGAAGVRPLLGWFGVDGVAGGLGFGWLMACVVLSGSPVAAMALALLASGTLSTGEAFAMIAGSRLGASFVVLLVGALDDLWRGRREKRSAYIGVAALVVTAVVYVPAMALGYLGLRAGLLEGLRIDGREQASLLDRTLGPLTSLAAASLPPLPLFIFGALVLLASFKLFDRALPDLQVGGGPVARVGQVVYRPWFMFALGLGVTALTLSVSVSLSLLVPLAAKGYVRRENVFPYILGANITTFIDTLLAGALVGHPDGVRVVALLMASVTLLSLPLVFVLPYAFERFVDGIARRATVDARALLVFVLLLLLVPAALIVV